MVFKGCRRCNGDLWAEEDVFSRLEDLVCVQCGRRQAVQAALAGPTIEEPANAARRPMPRRRSKVSA